MTTTQFDGVGNVISVTDPDGNTTTYAYNARNEQVAMTDPLGQTKTYAYDPVGNLVSATDRDGRITNNAYDTDDRLTQTVWLASDGTTVTDTKSYAYDANGNMLSATDNAGTYSMTYDADDRLATQTDPFGLKLTYGYDGNGSTVSEIDSLGGSTTSLYDGDNRLVSRRFSDGSSQLRIDLTYDGNGNILTESRYADLAGSQKVGSEQDIYDADNRVTEIVDKDASGNVIEDFQSSYDPAGRLTTETDNGVATHFTYDATNQLLSDGSNTYSYDANGNRTNPGYVTGANNQLLSDGTWNYSYDNEGNLVQKVNIATSEKWAYTYDNDNQMTSAVDQAADGTMLSSEAITYDAFDNRVEQDVSTPNGGTTVSRYAYDGMNVWADLNGSDQIVTRRMFLDGVDQLAARITAGSGAETWYLTDRQGSIRGLTDGSGGLQNQITYDSFGNVVSETNASFGDRYKYTGREFDNVTGLQYNWARYYDGTTARWYSQDPSGISFGGANLYRYVDNNPTNFTDPTGLAVAPHPPYTEKIARDILEKQVGAWTSNGWNFPANLLQYFLDKKANPNNKTVYVASEMESNEVKSHATKLAREVIEARVGPHLFDNIAAFGQQGANSRLGQFATGTVFVRWFPTGFIGRQAYNSMLLGEYPEFQGFDDFMFAAFYGARMAIRGTAFNVRPWTAASDQGVAFDACVEVTITDYYDFPPGKFNNRLILSALLFGPEYRAAYYLDKILRYPEFYVKVEYLATYKNLVYIAPMIFDD